jgi:four helix bundle protein
MGQIRKFEEIQSWQKARGLSQAIYNITKNSELSKDFALRDQLRRSGISVMSNITEGFARRTNKEFINFLGLAHGSVAELQSQLYIALDQQYISKEQFHAIYCLAEETSKLIQGLAKYLKKRNT